jgi:hypothetical protein
VDEGRDGAERGVDPAEGERAVGPAVDPHAPTPALPGREGDDAAGVLGDEGLAPFEPVQAEPEGTLARHDEGERDEANGRPGEGSPPLGLRDADGGEDQAGEDQEA